MKYILVCKKAKRKEANNDARIASKGESRINGCKKVLKIDNDGVITRYETCWTYTSTEREGERERDTSLVYVDYATLMAL